MCQRIKLINRTNPLWWTRSIQVFPVVEVLKCPFTPFSNKLERSRLCWAARLALKLSTGLLNFTPLEEGFLIQRYSVSFLKTTLIWPRGLPSCWCWPHLQHFTFLLGSWEPSFLHVPWGICSQPKFPPTALNNFSERCDYRSLLCLSPQAAAVCSQEL